MVKTSLQKREEERRHNEENERRRKEDDRRRKEEERRKIEERRQKEERRKSGVRDSREKSPPKPVKNPENIDFYNDLSIFCVHQFDFF